MPQLLDPIQMVSWNKNPNQLVGLKICELWSRSLLFSACITASSQYFFQALSTGNPQLLVGGQRGRHYGPELDFATAYYEKIGISLELELELSQQTWPPSSYIGAPQLELAVTHSLPRKLRCQIL